MSAAPSIALACALVFCTAACSRFERARECNGYARLLNHALDEVSVDLKKPSVAAYERVAERYARLAKDLERVRPKEAAMQQLLADYRTLYRQTTATLRHCIPLLGKPEHAAALRREKSTLESLQRQEKSLAHRFETTCRGP